jgi:hypothetical protein
MPTSQYAQQTEAILKAAQGGVPAHLLTAAQEGLAKTREVTRSSIATARDSAEVVEQVLKDARTLTEKNLQNFVVNTEAAFDAAQAIVRANNPIEAAQLQAKFLQNQIAKAGEQSKELYELASKQMQQTIASWNSIATKSFARVPA